MTGPSIERLAGADVGAARGALELVVDDLETLAPETPVLDDGLLDEVGSLEVASVDAGSAPVPGAVEAARPVLPGLVWKLARRARPAAVAARTGAVRRISSSSVREAFGVDLVGGDAQHGEAAPEGVDEGRRAADVDVALGDVGHVVAQGGDPQSVRLVVADLGPE